MWTSARMLRARASSLAALVVFWAAASASGAIGLERTGGPFVPTPQNVVEFMLHYAKVGPNDLVVDLGSGDGRMVLTAARHFGARALGVELDAGLVAKSAASARKLGVASRATFIAQDMLKADLRQATVVTLYVLPGMMDLLRPKLLAELAPGARIVSHDFSFDQWRPDAMETIDAPEKAPVNREGTARIYLWVVPADVQGEWRGQVGGKPVTVRLAQRFQVIAGDVETPTGRQALVEPVLDGDRIELAFGEPGARTLLRGRVRGGTIEGEATAAGAGAPTPWRLERMAPAR